VPKIASALQIADFSRRAPSFWRPTRGRQRLRDLERLRQPLLAGALLRRHGRRHRRPVLRRRTLRGIGARHPAAARRRARARLGRRPRRGGGGRVGQPAHAPRRISATGAASTSPHPTAPRSTNAAPTGFLSSCASTTGPGRGVDDRAREGRTRPGRGSIAYRFHARRASRALTRPTGRFPSAWSSTARLPASHTASTFDENGNGVLRDGRLYHLVRQHDTIGDQTLEITFLQPGAESYVFTFG
jgi:Thioredoxin like C-terminal domain